MWWVMTNEGSYYAGSTVEDVGTLLYFLFSKKLSISLPLIDVLTVTTSITGKFKIKV